jgi:hypothetical protein
MKTATHTAPQTTPINRIIVVQIYTITQAQSTVGIPLLKSITSPGDLALVNPCVELEEPWSAGQGCTVRPLCKQAPGKGRLNKGPDGSWSEWRNGSSKLNAEAAWGPTVTLIKHLYIFIDKLLISVLHISLERLITFYSSHAEG